MNRLLIIEGLPGSGKTTLAKRISKEIEKFSSNVKLFIEGDLHPADMAWCACLTAEQYKELCEKYPSYVKAFEENKENWQNYIILAYTKVENMNQELYDFLERHEVYDARVGKELFCKLHKSRWERFGQEASGINIFECSLLQNHVNELMLFHCEEEEVIYSYIKELTDAVLRLRPLVIYLDIDSKTSIRRASEERIDPEGNRVWESRVLEYIAHSPYGKKHGLTDLQGMYDYFEERKCQELKILEQLPVETIVLPVKVDNQDEMEEEFIQELVMRLGIKQ